MSQTANNFAAGDVVGHWVVLKFLGNRPRTGKAGFEPWYEVRSGCGQLTKNISQHNLLCGADHSNCRGCPRRTGARGRPRGSGETTGKGWSGMMLRCKAKTHGGRLVCGAVERVSRLAQHLRDVHGIEATAPTVWFTPLAEKQHEEEETA